MQRDFAQTIALQALEWLAGHDELSEVFMGATGTTLKDMAARADDDEYQLSVLEFLTMDDAWVKEFCDSINLGYDQPLQARLLLAGPAAGHWT